jgi:hypothetical protein
MLSADMPMNPGESFVSASASAVWNTHTYELYPGNFPDIASSFGNYNQPTEVYLNNGKAVPWTVIDKNNWDKSWSSRASEYVDKVFLRTM